MGIRSSIGATLAQRFLACRVRDLTAQALDDLDAAQPQDLATLERDLAAVDALPESLEDRVDALEQAAVALERAVADLSS